MIWRMERKEAWQLLRDMAAEQWGLGELPTVGKLEGGKPWFPDHPRCCFNLSHSGDFSLCALSDRPVGADLEHIRPRRDSLPAYVSSPEELDWFESRGRRWEDFYVLWTMKEARVKCTGQGLRVPTREISVPLPSEGETVLEHQGFQFTLLSGEGWRGALCQYLE